VQQITAAAAARNGGDVLLAHTAALKELWLLAYREALTQSFADAYLAILVCFVVATLLVPLMRRAVTPAAAPTDAH